MSSNNPNLTKAQRREAALAEAQKARQAQQARDKRVRLITISLLIVAVLAVAAIVLFIAREQDAREADPMRGATVPATATLDQSTGIPMGTTGTAGTTTEGAVEVGVYLDYMCPICGSFESTNGEALDTMREAGTITEVLHPISILDRMSEGTEFSTRAASAAAYVAENAPDQLAAFNDAMFTNQPEENTAGLTDAQIAEIAVGAGVPQDVADEIGSGKAKSTFADWVKGSTTLVGSESGPLKGAFTGTPTITINGEVWGTNGEWQTAGELEKAVAAAKG